MSDNIVAAVATTAVLETAAAAPSALHFNLEAAPFIYFTQAEYVVLMTKNEALKAENAALRTAYQLLAMSANAGLTAYQKIDLAEEDFCEQALINFAGVIDTAFRDVKYALTGGILEPLPAVDEAAAVDAAEAEAAAETDAKERAQAQAAFGDSWGDETHEKTETLRSAPLPAAPVAAAKPKPSGVKPDIKANRPWLFLEKPIKNWLKAEMDKSIVAKKCKYGVNCTNIACNFEHFCNYAAYENSGKIVYKLECKKNPGACSHVHHICDCQNKGCKAVHLAKLPESLEHLYYDSTA